MTSYGLNIVFYMKTYIQFQLEGTSSKFEFDDLKFKLTKLNDIDDSYSLEVKPVDNMQHARYILNKIKLALMLSVLEYNWAAIEIDEDIKEAHMFEEPISEDGFIALGNYKKNETTLFPLTNIFVNKDSAFAEVINLLNVDKLVKNIDNAFSLNHENIYDDNKLSLALEIYSQHSQFSRKRQFLDLVTILEILKPEYEVSENSIEIISSIKNDLKKLRNKFEKDSDEYKEFDRYFQDMHFWETKSINKSLQQFAIGYQDKFNKYEDIDVKIKKIYTIRSNMVHNGIIDEEFDLYFDFLKDFVGDLLKIKLDFCVI